MAIPATPNDTSYDSPRFTPNQAANWLPTTWPTLERVSEPIAPRSGEEYEQLGQTPTDDKHEIDADGPTDEEE